MGKYSMELLRALAHNETFTASRKIVLLFNKNLSMDEDMLEAAKRALPDAEIVTVSLKIRTEGASLPHQIKKNQTYIDSFVADNYAEYEVEFLILSLFLSEGATAFPAVAKKIVLAYDLIMLQFFEMYLGFGASDQHFGHYKTLFQADLYLTISETVANDLVTTLGISKDQIVSIDGGAIERQAIKTVKPTNAPTKPFILMPTGGDHRKNNHRGVRAFERFNAEHGKAYQLVLTSTFAPQLVHALNAISDGLHFTGNIEEEELAWLYEHCQGVLFPSEYEGLGLPILEAVEFNKPVACSDISVFREISTEAFYYFDPYNIPHMAQAIEDMVAGTDWSTKLDSYKKVTDQYSWARSVKRMVAAIDSCTARVAQQALPERAVIAPNVMVDNQLSRFVGMQYPQDSQVSNIDYYYDLGVKPKPARPNHLAFSATCRELAEFGREDYLGYDIVDYHIANNAGSIHTLVKALALPGTVYLHSPSLDRTFARALKHGYMSSGRYQLEARLGELYKDSSWLISLLSCSQRVITYDKTIHRQLLSLAKRLPKAADIELQAFPGHELPYKPAPSLEHMPCIGLVVGCDISGVHEVFDAAIERWGMDVSYKVFLDGLKEEKYYEEVGLDYPNFVPHFSSTDYGFDLFLQQIDTYYSYQDTRETAARFIEQMAAARGIEIAKP